MKKADLLILYGSLRHELPDFARLHLNRQLIFCQKVRLPGRLVDLGAYPGLLPGGEDWVAGDLFRLRPGKDFRMLDAYEGYRRFDHRPYDAGRGTGSEYLRVLTPYHGANGDMGEAYVYAYNGAVEKGARKDAPLVKGGDWISYLVLKDANRAYRRCR